MNTTNKNKPRAIGYKRVSTADQVNYGNSLVTQAKWIAESATRDGFCLDKVFSDEGISAKTLKRPGITELRKLVSEDKGKKITRLYVHTTDRLSRDAIDGLSLIRELETYGIEIVTSEGTLSLKKPDRFLVSGVLSMMAEASNMGRSSSSKSGYNTGSLMGRYLSKAPFGYKNQKLAKDSSIIPHPTHGPLVIEAFSRVANSESPTHVWIDMTNKGLRLCYSAFMAMLRRTTYYGTFSASGKTYQGSYKPLISKALFDTVQLHLQGKKKVGTKYDYNNPDFPLRGLIKCPDCGASITGSWSTGRHGNKYPYYRCIHCSGNNTSRNKVDDAFTRYLSSLSLSKQRAAALEKVLSEVWKKQNELSLKRIKQLEQQKTDIEQNKVGTLNLLVRGEISFDEKTIMIAGYDRELSIVTDELNELNNRTSEDIKAFIRFGVRLANKPSEVWQHLQVENKKRFQTFVFPDGLAMTEKTKFRTANIRLLEQINKLSVQSNSSLVAPRRIELRFQA